MKPSELKVGTVFYECQYGYNLKAITTTEPVRSIDIWNGEEKVRWSWIAVNAFKGGNGTAHMMKIGREAGVPVYEVKG